MLNKRFSLYDAYNFGFKSVLNHFVFFLLTMFVGSIASLVFLSFLGVLDYWMFHEHFQTLIKTFSHAMNEATGAIHQAGTTIHDHMQGIIPASFTKHLSPKDVVSIDIAGQDFTALAKLLLPVALGFKLFLEVIAVGWSKMALDLQENKPVDLEYLYKFYYFVPRVFVVNLVVGLLSMLGFMLLFVPGVFVYQRLRFARYFVIDKDQSIMQALESSWKMTEGSVIHLVGYTVFAGLLAGLSNTLFLTALFLFPLAYLVEASVYRQMVK